MIGIPALGLAQALSLGLDMRITIEAPFAEMHKADVVRLGLSLGVPFELTLSCMQPVIVAGAVPLHCGLCSKCRERRDAFRDAGVSDPSTYANRSPREEEYHQSRIANDRRHRLHRGGGLGRRRFG